MFKKLSVACALLGLLACGGGGGSTSNGGGTVTPPPPSQPVTFPGKFRQNTMALATQATQEFVNAQTNVQSGLFAPATTLQGTNPTKDMHVKRVEHSTVFLPNGKILVVGGNTSNGSQGSELLEYFDPATEMFYELGNLKYGRIGASAFLMGDGRVYIFGGVTQIYGNPLPNSDRYLVEILDPTTGKIDTSYCGFAPVSHFTQGFKISDTKILFVGGIKFGGGSGAIDPDLNPTVVDITDMSFAEIDKTGVYQIADFGYAQTSNGDVYIAGGRTLSTGIHRMEISRFSCATGKIAPVAYLPKAVMAPALVTLKDGNILLAGGYITLQSMETPIYNLNVTSGQLTKVADMPQGRCEQKGVQLPNGRILLAGGNNVGFGVADQLVYDPTTKTCGYTGKMITTRFKHQLNILPTGRILITGGFGNATGQQNDYQSSAEIFEPEANVYITFDTLQIPAGASYLFKAEYKGTVTWSCSQGTIDSNGLWTAPWNYTDSTATITATSTTDVAKFAYCFITISDPKKVITVYGKKVIAVNEEDQLTASVYYLNPKTVIWTTSAAATDATIDSNGLFKGLKPGAYKVQATSTIDSRYTREVTITVQ